MVVYMQACVCSKDVLTVRMCLERKCWRDLWKETLFEPWVIHFRLFKDAVANSYVIWSKNSEGREKWLTASFKADVSTIWARQRSRYSDWLRAGRSGDRIPVGARFSAPIQTGPGAHPASCTIGTGSFLGVKRLGRDADPSTPSSAVVMKG